MNKNRGIYYTPDRLATFMTRRALRHFPKSGRLRVLEPSVGKGAFVRALAECDALVSCGVDLTLVEIQQSALNEAVSEANSHEYLRLVQAIRGDFLAVSDMETRFSLIIGNPPYVKKNSLSARALDACRSVYRRAELPEAAVLNLWPAFVIESERHLRDDGIMAFVLPADLLQVKYAECIREYLEERFQRLEVFALGLDAFHGIEQQTVLLFAFREHAEKGTFFYRVADYEKGEVERISSNGLMVSQSKWTHFNLATEEVELLNKTAAKCQRLGMMMHSKPGIVTGANDFFILSEDAVRKHGAGAYVIPILRGSRWIEKGTDISEEHFQRYVDSGCPSLLLDLRKKRKNTRLDRYIENGKRRGVHMGYKCSNRKLWYAVPNIGKPGSAVFFKRSHLLPKLLRNVAEVYVTDAAYLIEATPGFELGSLIWSFYNPLTLSFAELTGRRYGGGVLELTPNELRDLPVPYCAVDDSAFAAFSGSLVFNDRSAAFLAGKGRESQLKVDKATYTALCKIYIKLVNQRVPMQASVPA